MLITISDLEREPLVFDVSLSSGEIDYGEEVKQVGPLGVAGRAELIEEHRGPREVVPDIRLRAKYQGKVEVACARCLDAVEHSLKGDFDLIFRPLGIDQGASERSINTDETEIGYYQKSGLVLEDVLREQVLLSLPARTLCRHDCKGLCPRCGQNLNSDVCTCDAAPVDPRWAALSDLGSRMKS
ncbi:DUF177 domain-containing protein [Alloacidobacterium dinghuense]|uniref:DUF177 domain-containing protein n=1 Tax=Alloacidobacterium dinghuense TaxID=2763107 RepID=A0A7G8BG02_9BACT|nr:DUF177 domain-containing protein [Alloacidobacterium dinghuense]QNI31472.1 DUF177 domain-containing protein [Alloacidobacterium dinghuense]